MPSHAIFIVEARGVPEDDAEDNSEEGDDDGPIKILYPGQLTVPRGHREIHTERRRATRLVDDRWPTRWHLRFRCKTVCAMVWLARWDVSSNDEAAGQVWPAFGDESAQLAAPIRIPTFISFGLNVLNTLHNYAGPSLLIQSILRLYDLRPSEN